MKKYIGLIIFGLIIAILIVVALVFSEDESKYIKEISMNEVTSKLEKKKDFILYIKQTDCEHCKEFTPRLISVLKEKNLKVYALNLTNLSKDEEKVYEKTFEVDGTPTVLFFKDGEEQMIRIEGEQTKAKIESKIKSAGFIK
ncbi:MAG: thioredoxin family protein [bacterium]|nr:thioredoxin family protein [bacterium]